MIPFKGDVQNRQMQRQREDWWLPETQEEGMGGTANGYGFRLVMETSWGRMVAMVAPHCECLNVIKLHTLKWLNEKFYVTCTLQLKK